MVADGRVAAPGAAWWWQTLLELALGMVLIGGWVYPANAFDQIPITRPTSQPESPMPSRCTHAHSSPVNPWLGVA